MLAEIRRTRRVHNQEEHPDLKMDSSMNSASFFPRYLALYRKPEGPAVELYWYRLNWLARDLVLVPRIWKPALRLCWSQPPVAVSDIATVATSAVSTPRTEKQMCKAFS
ncbi:hypothetical protein B0H14DRAFT_2613813 [Mycena olivaceomarginata]|nr:hypothetical protein B0H14DRAFT_2613813 [Mycena olivaceomarginata]